MYLFTWESPAMAGALGACHALEIPFVFGNLDIPTMDRFAGAGPDARRLSEQMSEAWIAFARTGDPHHAGIPRWPTYDTARRATLEFGPQTRVIDAPFDEERRVWEPSG
jgi:para-nitrobenzyl esterase